MLEGVRWKVFFMRLVMSALFASLLLGFFIPKAGWWGWIGMTGLLLFFSYVFEAVHERKDTKRK